MPALLLTCVAIAQVRLTRSEGLTPWKGGGFGMFSTTDDGLGRPMGIRVSGPAGDRPIGVPEPLGQDAARAAILPSRARLSALAREIARRSEREGAPVSAVRIAVWRLSYDPGTLAPRPVVVRDVRIPIEGPGR